MNFVPLHVNTAYSFLSSSVLLNKLILKLKKESFDSCGISDFGTLFSWPSFEKVAQENKVNSIFGIDINIENNIFTLFCKNEDDYKNIIKISFLLSKKDNQLFTIEEIKPYVSDIIAVISTEDSNIFSLNSYDLIAAELKNYNKIFKDIYIGIESYENNAKKVDFIRGFFSVYPYNFLAFPHIKYLNKEDAIALEILDCIKKNEHLCAETDVKKDGVNYLINKEEAGKLYTEQELLNTITFSSLFSFKVNKKRGTLLEFGDDSKEVLRDLTFKKLNELQLNTNDQYLSRLNYELDVIDKMGYNNYFLIVQDYVNFAKENNILVGPGRGSAAGSLVSFLLSITEVDPLKFDLLFERFLNPARVSMPDIDIDFEDVRRDEIVEYLKKKYGSDKVANISTIQTIQAKQSLRDIGRVFDINPDDIDKMCKLLTNQKYSLMESYSFIEPFRNLILSDSYFQKIFKLALRIENCPRQHGLHAAGVILNNDNLEQSLPLIIDQNTKTLISQYEMNFLEKQGFLKMDILGLTNLSTIKLILYLIKANRNIDIKFEDIPIEDPCIFDPLINKFMTNGLFQLESSGMNNAISQIHPTSFNDIAAILALFRPGPMESIPVYAQRKNSNAKIVYLVPELEPILKPTYGIIIYQEQIMQIAQTIAGFSLAEADILRKAISKKNALEIDKLKKQFIDGSIKKGYSQQKSQELYALIEKFASYGFNKSHSVAYAIITTRMAYLKAKYPEEFYVAVLSNTVGSNDSKFKNYLTEMSARGINVSVPLINYTDKIFSIINDKLFMPITAIKGLMSTVTDSILYERKIHGPFKGFYNFVYRMFDYSMTEPTLSKLIKAGVFDEFTLNRASLLVSTKDCLRAVSLAKKSKGQCSIFEDSFRIKTETIEDKKVRINDEYEVLGIMITDNPLLDLKEKFNITDDTTIENFAVDTQVKLVAYIQSKKIITTKKSKEQMAFIKVFDQNNNVCEVTVFPRIYTQCANDLANNNAVLIEGRIENGNRGLQLIAETLTILEKQQENNDE